jgi:molybdopterin-synthase adenylyltransferase
MAVVRIPERVFAAIRAHLLSTPGEHFAFMLARVSVSGGAPVFLVEDAIIIPDREVAWTRHGFELQTEALLDAINAAVRSGRSLIEVHNHGGTQPRFSHTDRLGLEEIVPYVLSSLAGRPYAATVWGDHTVYGEFFTPGGRSGVVRSIAVSRPHLQQLVSRDDDEAPLEAAFDRQLPWFSGAGQRSLGRLRAGIVGNGGTGSQLLKDLVYLGVRDFVLVDDDIAEDTNMNRLVTAEAADVGTPKVILGRRLIKAVAPAAQVIAIRARIQSSEAIDRLRGVDVLFGCVDNDGARLILNEIALAYSIPYFDLGVGIDATDGVARAAGGRVAAVLPGGPCLACMGELDFNEARYFLSSPEQQALQRERGYVQGMDVKAPAVVSLNGTIASMAVTEFAMLLSRVRPVNLYSELDLLGSGRPIKSQWVTPVTVQANPACLQCLSAATCDDSGVQRYTND